jgi:uncharacterized protein (UPF0248 family)
VQIRESLNKIRWDSSTKEEEYEVSFLHRNEEFEEKTISFPQITTISSSWFQYMNQFNIETLIPFHRILEIRNVRANEILWKRKKHKSGAVISDTCKF